MFLLVKTEKKNLAFDLTGCLLVRSEQDGVDMIHVVHPTFEAKGKDFPADSCFLSSDSLEEISLWLGIGRSDQLVDKSKNQG